MPISRCYRFIAALCVVSIHLNPVAAESYRQGCRNLTQHVEVIGNPFREKYPDGEWSFARNVWDMEVYDDRLYLGHGNSNNDFPAPNAGPVDVWSFDASTELFVNEYTVQEEQIERFRIINGTLVIPGHDPTEGGSTGSLYYLVDDNWTRAQSIPNVLHVYDVYWFENQLLVAKSPGAAAAVSRNMDAAWIEIQIFDKTQAGEAGTISRGWEFFTLGNQLFLSVQMPVVLAAATPPSTPVPIVLDKPAVYRYDGNGFSAVMTDFFPDRGELLYPLRVARSVEFMDRAVYIGAELTSFHNWVPIGLFAADTSLQVSRLMPHLDFLPWDILLEDGVLYVLTATKDELRHNTIVAVAATCDLQTWHEVLRFTATTFARSFVMYRGDFYFGLGTNASSLSPATGDILRVKGEYFDFICP